MRAKGDGMVTIAGRWELSWNTPIKEFELWNLAMRQFGVTDLYMWPVSGIRSPKNDVHVHEYPHLDDYLPIVRELGTLVYCEPAFPKAEPDHQFLPEFKHPEDAVYIFGSAHYNPCSHRKTENDIALAIPTIQGGGTLWPHQCMVTILYDRMVKSWQ